MHLSCVRCKRDIEIPQKNRRFCIECAKERKRESNRLWGKLKRQPRPNRIRRHCTANLQRVMIGSREEVSPDGEGGHASYQ
jgi:hypothetical protein